MLGIVLDAGKVMEEGTPEELIEKRRWFASFANAEDEEEYEEDHEDEDEAGDK